MSVDIHSHLDAAKKLLDGQQPFVTVTLVGIRGSAPQIVGAKALVTKEGIVFGTVGGGKIEAAAIRHAQELLSSADGRENDFVTWNLQTEIGMTCGGEVQFFFEVALCNDWQVAIFGAGHIAQAVIPILLTMQCRVTCVDQRSDWLERLPDAPQLTRICEQDLASQVVNLPPKCFFALMTQGHSTDLPVLAQVLKTRNAPYLGVLGSLQKAKVLRRDLESMGLSKEEIDSFHCPMGMPLGNNTPPEIAISIVTQLIQQRDAAGIVQHKTKKF